MVDEQPPQTKRRRGEAKLEWLSKLQRGEKISYEHSHGLPIRKNASKIISFIGKLAKDGINFPFDKHSWDDIFELDKSIERALNEVKSIFHWHPESEHWFIRTLDDRWRQNKYKKKKEYFDKYTTIVEWYSNCPRGVIESQWRNMVDYWQTTDFKEISERNKKNKEKQKTVHIAGSKSFMNHTADIEKETNKPATRVEIYKRTHRRSDELAGQIMKAAEDGMSSQEDTSQLDGDIYSQVMGPEKPGRNRGVGIGVKSKTVRRGSKSYASQDNDESLQMMREQVSVLRQQNADLLKERNEMRKHQEDMLKRQEQMQKNQEQMQKSMKLMMSYVV